MISGKGFARQLGRGWSSRELPQQVFQPLLQLGSHWKPQRQRTVQRRCLAGSLSPRRRHQPSRPRQASFCTTHALSSPASSATRPKNAPPPTFTPDSPASYTDSSTALPEHNVQALDLVRLIDPLDLRDSCSCARCVDPSTSQKRFETAALSPELAVAYARDLPTGQIEVQWSDDLPGWSDHRSCFTRRELLRRLDRQKQHRDSGEVWDYRMWTRSMLENEEGRNLHFEYGAYMEQLSTLRQVVSQLHRLGLVFLHGVPDDENSVARIGERIGPLRNSFYGSTWDVRSEVSPVNAAYTAEALDLHMDLLYMADPPGVQVLHCLRQSTQGGASTFSDGLRAFDQLQSRQPPLAHHLAHFPVTFRYKNGHHWYQMTRSMLEGRGFSAASRGPFQYQRDFDSLNWSPPFQGPLMLPTDAQAVALRSAPSDHTSQGSRGRVSEKSFENPSIEHRSLLQKYVMAAKAFKHEAADLQNVYKTLMAPGTCVIFQNRRILHGRQAFDAQAGGQRWLRGCYVDSDALRSRYRTLVLGKQAD